MSRVGPAFEGHNTNTQPHPGDFTWLRHYLPQAVARLYAIRPKLAVRIHSGSHDSLIPRLREGELDIVLSALRPNEFLVDDLITHEPLVEDALVLLVRKQHPLAANKAIRPEALLEYPWIIPLSDMQNRQVLEAAFRRCGLAIPAPAVETSSVTFALSLLREGNHLSFQAFHYLRSPEAEGLTALDFPSFSWRRAAGVSFRNTGTMSPGVRLLLSELKSILANTGQDGLSDNASR